MSGRTAPKRAALRVSEQGAAGESRTNGVRGRIAEPGTTTFLILTTSGHTTNPDLKISSGYGYFI